MNIKKEPITRKNGHNLTKTCFLTCFIFFIVTVCFARNIIVPQEKNSMNCCYNYVLNKIKNNFNKPISPFKPTVANSDYNVSIDKKRLIIKSKSKGLVSLKSAHNDINEWNNIVDWNKAKYSFSGNAHFSILIVVAPVAGASGLETNFYKYLIINLNNGAFQIEQSLSNDHRFIFNNRNALEFYFFDYSKRFLKERDYDSISLDIKHYQFDGINLRMLGTNVRTCDCSVR